MKKVLAAVIVCYMPLTAWSQSETFTLEHIMGAPFPASLVAAPTGGSLAWVFNNRGERNIWVASPPGYDGKALTDYEGDDGQDLTSLAWASDAASIVYVRGGNPNRQGEVPNPLSVPGGRRQEVWVVPTGGGAPRRLGEGSSPAVAPRQDRVAFLKQGQIWWAPLDGSSDAEHLVRARGEADQLRWSPDGSQLAFTSRRGDHSFIGVYSWKGQSLLFLEPSVDRDSNPVWSPDGKHVAYIRIPASRGRYIFGPERTGQPWSIRVVDVSTGIGREVWRATDGRGSVFRNIMATNRLFWSKDDHLVFPWERDGWTHLFSVPANGGDVKHLTPGHFEVEYVSLSADGRDILFNSNQDDIDRRHVWRVPAAGGAPTALTRGDGIEWSPVETGDGKAVAFLRSNARLPIRRSW